MVNLLRKTYPDLQEEVLIDKYYIVDAYSPSKKLCIEIEGPLHYNHLGKLNRKSSTKRRVLEHLGYHVNSIDGLRVLKVQNLHRKDDRTVEYL